MKGLNQFFRLQKLTILVAVIAAFASLPSLVRAQSTDLSVCEPFNLDVYEGNVLYYQVNCITEWTSDGTPYVLGSVEVTSQDTAYYPYVDAKITMGDGEGNFLGQADYNQFEDPPTGSSDAWVSLTATETPEDIYAMNGGYGYCYDPTGSYGANGCNWTDYGSNPSEDLATNIFDPSYQVVSLLYAPPGNQSTEGFGDFTTNGTTTSVGSSFQNAKQISFSGGVLYGETVSIGYSTTTSNSSAYQTTLTNQSGMTEEANTKSAYNPNGLNMPERQWDTFEVLLDPQITTASDDSNNVLGYAMDLQPANEQGWHAYQDLVPAVAEDMLNGTVPAGTLNQQIFPNEGGSGNVYQPGFASICASLIASEYNNNSCTLGDQCGCQLSDFSGILGQDGLLGWNSATLTANPVPAYTSPLTVDTSGVTACEQPTSSDSCRYVPVPVSNSNPSPVSVLLDYASDNSF